MWLRGANCVAFQTHQEECEYNEGEVLCEFCKILLEKSQEAVHYGLCQKFLVPCPSGCGVTELPREKVQEHLDNVCTKNEIQCPFIECGCAFKSKRGDMPKHLRWAAAAWPWRPTGLLMCALCV